MRNSQGLRKKERNKEKMKKLIIILVSFVVLLGLKPFYHAGEIVKSKELVGEKKEDVC